MRENTMPNEKLDRLKNILTGNVKIDFITHKLLPLILIVFVGFLSISWLLYPLTSYSMLTKTISSLGHPRDSALGGWIVWSAGMTASAFLFIPLLTFTFRKLFTGHVLNKILIAFGSFFFCCTIWGMIFLGAIPQFSHIHWIYGLYHAVNAILAFGGMYLGMGLFALSMMVHMILNKRKKDKLMIVFNLCWWIPPIGLGWAEYTRAAYHIPKDTIWYLNFPFWEWILLIVGFVALLLMFHMAIEEE